ncbi:MAG: hypothetical protein ABJA78_18775 [Ferruginibacter sp.]
MRKIVLLLFCATVVTVNAQTKNYISIEKGITICSQSRSISNAMDKNGFKDHYHNDLSLIIITLTGDDADNSQTLEEQGNYRIRYGYHLRAKSAVEIGFGHSYNCTVWGSTVAGNDLNTITVEDKSDLAYAAYMCNTASGNKGIGIGPALSFCKMQQYSHSGQNTQLIEKKYVLPGAILTSYWNFVNRKNWFLGLRTDVMLTAPLKIDEMKITNKNDPNFTSVFKQSTAGNSMFALTLTGAVKF